MKIHTGARAREQKYISIYISLCMKTFLKTGVYIYIYMYIRTLELGQKHLLATQIEHFLVDDQFEFRHFIIYIYICIYLYSKPNQMRIHDVLLH